MFQKARYKRHNLKRGKSACIALASTSLILSCELLPVPDIQCQIHGSAYFFCHIKIWCQTKQLSTASTYARAVKFAVNLEDVRDFLYHFERSAILQYFILSQYKTKMMTEGDFIKKEIKAKESNQQEQEKEES
jgi:hypothetical protein